MAAATYTLTGRIQVDGVTLQSTYVVFVDTDSDDIRSIPEKTLHVVALLDLDASQVVRGRVALTGGVAGWYAGSLSMIKVADE